MTADQIADEIVAVFNALTGQQFVFTAEKPNDIIAVETERFDFGVYVIPKDEQEEAIGDQSDTCKRTRIVSIAVNGPIKVCEGWTLGKFAQQFEALRMALEGTEFSGYRWDRNEVVSLWDNDALRTRNRFLALFEATYCTFS